MRLTAAASIISLVSLVALAACSEPASQPQSAPTRAPAPAALAGVDLGQPVQVLGTEPFWSLEITPSRFLYSDPNGPALEVDHTDPAVLGTTATYSAVADSRSMTGKPGSCAVAIGPCADGFGKGREKESWIVEVTLIATECSDGMSDRTYPLTAVVKLGETTLNGCAGSRATLTAQAPA